MNKSDLIDAVAGDADLSKASAGRAVDAVLDGIAGALGNGDSVSLVGFGTFSVRLLERVEILKQELQCIFQRLRFQVLKLVKALKIRLSSAKNF